MTDRCVTMNIDDMRVGDFLYLIDTLQEECVSKRKCIMCRYHDICDNNDICSISTPDLKKVVEAYAEMNGLLEHMNYETSENEMKWIPCSERTPEECVPVNVTWINRNPEPYYEKIKDVRFSDTAVYCNGRWFWWSSTCIDYLKEYGKNDIDLVDKDIDVVAWMPFPEPYKGE